MAQRVRQQWNSGCSARPDGEATEKPVRGGARRIRAASLRRLCQVVAVGACAAIIPGGCGAAGEDITDLFRSMAPPTPAEAAGWLRDEDADRRREGTILLGNASFGGESAYVALYRVFASPDSESNPLVRAAALRALARHGAPSDAKALSAGLSDTNRQVRWEAARGLQRIHNREVIPDLITALRREDEVPEVRVAVADALGQYAEPRVFDALVRALDARELGINLAAQRSLIALTGQDHGLDGRAWLRWFESVPGDRFAGGSDYFYSVWERKPGFFDRLLFWQVRVVEQPGPPTGMPLRGTRRTWDEADRVENAPASGRS
ncbi:MAG: HEAT repeat domain-containing protein [Phycisphaeraceae bacterium]|nr:HEAT repeat domain-containing protein [Phycisphaeraceae bacterium]